MTQLAKRILFTIIRGYQKLISPLLPARCRYYPTCSHYGLQAIAWHGTRRGGWLTIKRICRCHPFGGHGIDFVPLPLYGFNFHYITESDLIISSDIQVTTVLTSSSQSQCLGSSSEKLSTKRAVINFYTQSNFVYIDKSDYSYQLNQWLKKPITDKY